ncbi:MAG: hypothetical protein HDR80_02515 [Bacteroides sp.]|nr:hypothetical protein [Bacteroides sp.]
MIAFIKNYDLQSPDELRLKFLSKPGLSPEEKEFYSNAILQIECRQKFGRKLRNFLSGHPDFIFSSSLSGEQASHERVAAYHASLAAGCTSLVDMTAGLGIDFITLASAISPGKGTDCMAVEMNPATAETLKANLALCGLPEAEVVNGDSLAAVRSLRPDSGRLIFADPARRGSQDSRIYDPRQCSPDVVGAWDELLSKCGLLLVKNSPMLDLKQALRLFPHTEYIHVVGVRNECKEVLIEARAGAEFKGVKCVDFRAGGAAQTIFISASDFLGDNNGNRADTLMTSDERSLKERLDKGMDLYLYEPNTSLMKTQCWQAPMNLFAKGSVEKLSPNSHIYVSPEHIDNFPGRVLHVDGIIGRRQIKRLKGGRYNIVTRNYPIKADALFQKIKVSPDAEKFIYGATVGVNETPILISGTLVNY